MMLPRCAEACVWSWRAQVAGKSVSEAVAQMAFSDRRRAKVIRHCIERAVNRADFYHGLTGESLKVAEAFSGKQITAPRLRHHGRGT
jgi:ribosomal protein L22